MNFGGRMPLFLFIFDFITYIHSFNHNTFIHRHQWGKLPCGAEPRIELGPALQQADALPTGPRRTMNFNQKYILAIYRPMIYTAPYVMLLMRANPLLRGQVGGDGPVEIEIFLGPLKWHQAVRRMAFGA